VIVLRIPLAVSLRESAFLLLCRRGGGFGRQYIATLGAGLFLALPILLFVHRYIDDVGRSMDGEIRWVQVGRPLAEWLFALVNLGGHGVAVAPLYQLLTIALVSVVGVIAARVYGVRSPLWTAVATLPLIGQPYVLENLSYGFDCLGMLLAMCLAVLASIAIAIEAGRTALITSVILLTASLGLYQPATSAFIPFALMLVLGAKLHLLEPAAAPRRSAMLWIGQILLSYLIALGLYSLLLRLTFHFPTSYASEQGQLLAIDAHLPFSLLRNSWAYWLAIVDDWNQWPLAGMFLALALAYTVVARRSLARLACILVCLLLIAALAPGALLALKDPLNGVPRMLVFVGPLFASLQLQIVSSLSRSTRDEMSASLRALPLAAVLAFAWFQIVFAYAYGHAFAAQAEFEAGRLSRLVDGISRLQQRQGQNQAAELSFVGRMPRSPVLRNTQRKFPLVNRLVPRLISDDWAWGWKQLQLHGIDLKRSRLLQQDLTGAFCGDLRTSECTSEYTIQIQARTLLVQIK
jgi:hypothetical protein